MLGVPRWLRQTYSAVLVCGLAVAGCSPAAGPPSPAPAPAVSKPPSSAASTPAAGAPALSQTAAPLPSSVAIDAGVAVITPAPAASVDPSPSAPASSGPSSVSAASSGTPPADTGVAVIAPAPSLPSPAPQAPGAAAPANANTGPVFLEDASNAQALAEDKEVAELLRTKYPNLRVLSVTRIPVESAVLYEFVGAADTEAGAANAPKGVVGYTDRAVGFVFLGGELVTGPTGRMINITKQRAQAAGERVLRNLPTEGALKMVYGKGERTLKVFSDPDCPFCRTLEKTMAADPARLNATVYIYPYPLTGLHPNANERARYMLCTANPSQSWHDWAVGPSTDEAAWSAFAASHPAQAGCPAASAVDRTMQMGRALGLAQTPVLIFENTTVWTEAPSFDALEDALTKAKTPAPSTP